MTAKRFATVSFATLGVIAIAQAGMTSGRARESALEMQDAASVVAGKTEATETEFSAGSTVTVAPDGMLNPAFIPKDGLSLRVDSQIESLGPGRSESHNQPQQLCKIYRTRLDFNTDHSGFADPCSGTQCSENFDATSAANAALLACTVGADVNCLANACAPLAAVNNGVSIREYNLTRDAAAPISQIGLLNAGPYNFGNRKDISGKYIQNNFFGDGIQMMFTGHADFPAACVGTSAAPTAVGWDQHNTQNMANVLNTVLVTLASGAQFVYTTEGRNAGSFTGVCCEEEIRLIQIQSLGNNTEGVDNLSYGVAGACVPGNEPVTNEDLSDQIEAINITGLDEIEAKLDRIEAILTPPNTSCTLYDCKK